MEDMSFFYCILCYNQTTIIYKMKRKHSMPMRIMQIFEGIVYTFIFIVSLVNTINPKWMWEKFESWKATKEYFCARRIVASIAIIIL